MGSAPWDCSGFWAWEATRRRGCVCTNCGVPPGRERLSGSVEADETYMGGLEAGMRGRQTESKALIVVAAEEDGKGIGWIRTRRIPDASAHSLISFVQESVEPGSVVHTDGWLGYEPLQGSGYIHRLTFLRGQQKSPSELLPRVHRVVSLLK
jgi:transposase-like protein